MFSRTLESALSAMACLAKVYDGGKTPLTAQQIAECHQLSKPIVSKHLTLLSASGLVVSKPGRNGGFTLARPPDQITLLDVANSVGYQPRVQCCPFSPDHGEHKGVNCPLHDNVAALLDQMQRFLQESTLEGFAAQAAQPQPKKRTRKRREPG